MTAVPEVRPTTDAGYLVPRAGEVHRRPAAPKPCSHINLRRGCDTGPDADPIEVWLWLGPFAYLAAAPLIWLIATVVAR